MTSKLAKQTVEKWWSEGLKPTVEDIVRLNALGLKVENGAEAYDFAACPRIAFLGDYMLFEPTVGKRAWMDAAKQALRDDYQTQLYFVAWALNCPDEELPRLDDARKLLGRVKKFAQDVLVGFTETQILAAVQYALTGADPSTGEDFAPEQAKALEEVCEIPSEVKSNARQLIAEALTQGMDADVKREVTAPQLERMIICAALNRGVDVLKNEHAQAAAKFYACAGRIHERLTKKEG